MISDPFLTLAERLGALTHEPKPLLGLAGHPQGKASRAVRQNKKDFRGTPAHRWLTASN